MTDDPDEELSFNETEALGLDGTGCDGNPRFPYTYGNLTVEERELLEFLRIVEDPRLA